MPRNIHYGHIHREPVNRLPVKCRSFMSTDARCFATGGTRKGGGHLPVVPLSSILCSFVGLIPFRCR